MVVHAILKANLLRNLYFLRLNLRRILNVKKKLGKLKHSDIEYSHGHHYNY